MGKREAWPVEANKLKAQQRTQKENVSRNAFGNVIQAQVAPAAHAATQQDHMLLRQPAAATFKIESALR